MTSRSAMWGAVALAGFASMALEMAAARLLAPTFGSSITVWSALIAVLMLGMAVGAALGGRLADRRSAVGIAGAALIGSGIWQGLALWVAPLVLNATADLGEVTGPALSGSLLLGPAIVGLATVSPAAVKHLAHPDDVGTTAGRVSALGTLGAVVGTVLTATSLLPSAGTWLTLQGLAALTLLVGVALATLRDRRAAAAIVGLVLLGAEESVPEGVIASGESVYNRVWVVDRGGVPVLSLNQANAMQSAGRGPWTGLYWDDAAFGPVLAGGSDTLLLGAGGGTAIGPIRAVAPGADITGVEIDPVVVELAEAHLGLPDDVDIHVSDARPWLRRSTLDWDVVYIDLYHGGAYVPFYLVTREFYGLVKDHLRDDGVAIANVFDPSGEILAGQVATLSSVFPSVYVLSRVGGNHTVFAFPSPTSLETVQTRVRRGHDRLARAADQIQPANADGEVWTDDRAPVSRLTRRMLAELR